MYQYFQSSKKKRSSDCSVRAIMAAESMNWEDAFSKLVAIAYEEQDVPNSGAVIEKTLSGMGYEKRKADMVTSLAGRRRMTVKQFAELHPKGTFILSLTGHVVCVKDGDWYDSWNCGAYKVFKYWEKVEAETLKKAAAKATKAASATKEVVAKRNTAII